MLTITDQTLETSTIATIPPPRTTATWTLRTATTKHSSYIEHLARLHSNSIGFVPRAAILNHLERHNYDLLEIDGQQAGYIMHGGGIRKPYRIIQVAIDEQLWRQGFGTLLLARSLVRARSRPQPTATATVADHLPMNDVAVATGATLTSIDTPPNARRRPLRHWQWTNGHILIPTTKLRSKATAT